MEWKLTKIRVLCLKGYRFKAKPSATLYLNGSIMKRETSYKYLGHIIDNILNGNKDIERQLRNYYGKSNMFIQFMFVRCKASVIYVILWFYVYNISPVWLHEKAIPTIAGGLYNWTIGGGL